MLYRMIRPLLFRATRRDPEVAHELGLGLIRFIGEHKLVREVTGAIARPKRAISLQQEICGMIFAHPLGLAAGFDKNCIALHGCEALGFSFAEDGTVTLPAQKGNPRPRMARYPRQQALINAMGFPNDGAGIVKINITESIEHFGKLSMPLCLSLGKAKNTPLDAAAREYQALLESLYRYADFFSVNVSSPNTQGLRELQGKGYLGEIMRRLVSTSQELAYRHGCAPKAIFAKVAPDLSRMEVEDILEVLLRERVTGIIAGNTTKDHLALNGAPTGGVGGLSGRPLLARALNMVRHIRTHTDDTFIIIGVGGIINPGDAYLMLSAGANLIQSYTGFVYHGPLFAKYIIRGIAREMRRDGVASIAELQRKHWRRGT